MMFSALCLLRRFETNFASSPSKGGSTGLKSKAAGSVLTAVSEGNLTPIEATRVMGLIDSYRRTLELTEIENRLKVLEDEFAST